MEKRLGFIGIIVDRKDSVAEVNRILSGYGYLIRGRIGVGALTGKLGNLPGITVKSALAPEKKTEGAN